MGSVRIINLSSAELLVDESRFDAAYYEGDWAERAILASGLPTKPLGELARVWFPGRFTRTYRPTGTPFVGSREMLFWPMRADKHLAQTQDNVDDLLVQTGDILVRRSGSVGATVRVTGDFAGVAVSEHALRVRATEAEGNLLYAFLRSSYGQAILERHAFGAVVNELEPEQLEAIRVPLPQDALISEINDLMEDAIHQLERGALLIRDASQLLLESAALRPTAELQPKYLSSPSRLAAFKVRSDALGDRFDGSYHLPQIEAVREELRSSALGAKPLESQSVVTVPGRFRRVYVARGEGTPLLQGAHVPMVRAEGVKSLSLGQNAAQDFSHRVHAGQVLVTCSGTLGRVGMVGALQDGWLASQHIARVTSTRGHAGFLYSFLTSDYGQIQIKGQTYGAVVDEPTEAQLGSILVPELRNEDVATINDLVVEAFAARDRAVTAEETAIALFETSVESAGS